MLHRKTEVAQGVGPEDLMYGKCGTCGNTLTTERYKAQQAPTGLVHGKEEGLFTDLLYVECPACLVESRKQFPFRKEHTAPRVYLTRRPVTSPLLPTKV